MDAAAATFVLLKPYLWHNFSEVNTVSVTLGT